MNKNVSSHKQTTSKHAHRRSFCSGDETTGTNWSPSAARLAADSARDHPWLEAAYLSQKLGVGAVVETTDGFLLSLCRSSGVAEGQGMMGAPGGHPEPEVGYVFFLFFCVWLG